MTVDESRIDRASQTPVTRNRHSHARSHRSGPRRLGIVAYWVVVPIAANLLVALQYRHTWFFYDEWSLIAQIFDHHGTVGSYFISYNGHLYVISHLIYVIQLHWVGTPGHAFVWISFCVCLLAWNYGVVVLLRVLNVPLLAAMAAGVMIVYFGPGAELSTFEFNLSSDGAYACLMFAGALALRRADHSRRVSVVVAGLLILAAFFDSGIAISGVVFLAALIVWKWSWIDAAIAIAAPAVLVMWATFTLQGPRWPAGLWTSVKFATTLSLRSTGGLVGTGTFGGIVLLGVSAIILVFGFRTGALQGNIGRSFIAGCAAAAVTVAAITQTRAGLANAVGPNSRYVGEVSLFILIAFLPSLWASVVVLMPSWRPAMVIGLTVAIITVFAVNLDGFRDSQRSFAIYDQQTFKLFPTALALVGLHCPNGAQVPGTYDLFGATDPQLTTYYLSQMKVRGLFSEVKPITPTVAVFAKACANK